MRRGLSDELTRRVGVAHQEIIRWAVPTLHEMNETLHTPSVAIVDYGLGNLYSVLRACQRVGLDARITSSQRDVLAADGVILPGVGAWRFRSMPRVERSVRC